MPLSEKNQYMKQWKAFKNIISAHGLQKDLFLTLIDESGNILCSNAVMQRSLHLENPRQVKSNFFNLLHPEHVATFQDAIRSSRSEKTPHAAELYLKNGHYHRMKWEVNYLARPGKKTGSFLCVGHNVKDEQITQLTPETKYQFLFDELNAGVFFIDKDGELMANRKTEAIFCVETGQLNSSCHLKAKWNDLHFSNRAGKIIDFEESPFMRSFHSGLQHSDVLIAKRCEGNTHWVQFNASPLMDEEGKPYAILTSIFDFPDEPALHNDLRDTGTLFRSFLDKTPNLAWVLDEDANLLFASASFYQYFGLIEEQALNNNIFSIIPSSVADTLYNKHVQVLENGTTTETVEKVKWSDGTNFIFHVTIFPIDSGSGKRMIGGHAVNLADKYAVEKQLREANDRLLLLSRATSDAIWEWDMQTGYIFRNDALMDMIGYQGEDARGLSWWLRRIHPEDRNRVTDTIKDATDKGRHSWEDEYRFKCSDGSYKHIQDHGYVVYENGLPVKMIGSLQDVTELKQLEDQLTMEKLQRQKEISETVIRVQEKERTRIGHELHDNVNQILSTTKMFVEMLTPASDEDKKLKEKSIEYLMASIEEIRKLSKELVVPQLKEKSLVESIYVLLEDIQMAGKLKIKFVHDIENSMLSPGKKVTIFRIVQEQFKNILKYSKAKQVDIHLNCKEENVMLVIKDNGVGFDPKKTHRGIGLSNIHDRARFYNGEVLIEAAPGKGCALTVTIPLF